MAYHEAGHALLSLLVPQADPLHKVSIIPRGVASLGYTMQLPLQDRYIIKKSELLAKMIVLLGGRAAEELIFGEETTGAQNDLEVATNIAKKMVCEYGMSPKLGNLIWGKKEGPVFLGKDLVERKDYSEQTAQVIDSEIKRIVEEAYQQAKKLLEENIDKLKILAQALLQQEILDAEEVRRIVGIEKNTEDADIQDRKPS